MSTLPPNFGEYAILPISMPPLPSYPVKVSHCLYVKRHTPKIPTDNDARSLYLVNVPIDSTEVHFRAIFISLVGAGRFETVSFENERRKASAGPRSGVTGKQDTTNKRKRGDRSETSEDRGQLPKIWDRELRQAGSTAVVLMVDERSVELVLKALRKVHKSGDYPVWGKGVEGKVPELGLQRYLNHQRMRYPDKATLQTSVDEFMTDFNRREDDSAKSAKRLRNVPDEDGFVTVTRGGRTGPARREEAEEARRKELEKEEEKRKSMGNFYRFQGREKRKEEQGELIRKFEEDRKRVENMKKGRKGMFIPE